MHVEIATIEQDRERLQTELQRMVEQKTQLDTAIVAQRGAISYTELLLARAKEQGSASAEESGGG